MDRKSDKSAQVKKDVDGLQAVLDQASKSLLMLLADPKRRDAGALTHLITYSQRLKDKLVNFTLKRSRFSKKTSSSKEFSGKMNTIST